MRRSPMPPRSRAVHAAVGAVMLAVPATAFALSGGPSSAGSPALEALGNQPVNVSGRLLPGQAGRRVALQELRAGRWYSVASGSTSRRGSFQLRYLPAGNTVHRLRVEFRGDRDNLATSAGAGTVTAYQPSVASWYDDTGETACGF